MLADNLLPETCCPWPLTAQVQTSCNGPWKYNLWGCKHSDKDNHVWGNPKNLWYSGQSTFSRQLISHNGPLLNYATVPVNNNLKPRPWTRKYSKCIIMKTWNKASTLGYCLQELIEDCVIPKWPKAIFFNLRKTTFVESFVLNLLQLKSHLPNG